MIVTSSSGNTADVRLDGSREGYLHLIRVIRDEVPDYSLKECKDIADGLYHAIHFVIDSRAARESHKAWLFNTYSRLTDDQRKQVDNILYSV
jgi:hypothetical protein